jgi:hypothetical protein
LLVAVGVMLTAFASRDEKTISFRRR